MSYRAAFLWFLAGGASGLMLASVSVSVPPATPVRLEIDTHEPPLALTEDELSGLSDRERFLFKRFADVADRRAERAIEARGPGIVAKAIGQTIDEATAAAEGRKTAGGIWAALGAKLFQFVRVALRLLFVGVLGDVIYTYWYIAGPLIFGVISVVVWINGGVVKLFGVKS